MAATKNEECGVVNGSMSEDEPDSSKSKEHLLNGINDLDPGKTEKPLKCLKNDNPPELDNHMLVNGTCESDQEPQNGVNKDESCSAVTENAEPEKLTNGESPSDENDDGDKDTSEVVNGERSKSETPQPVLNELSSENPGERTTSNTTESCMENGNQMENASTFSRDSTPLSDISSVTTTRSNTPLNIVTVLSSNEKSENSCTDNEKSETALEPTKVSGQNLRSSEERSNDSFESCSSSNSNIKGKGVPKARKSGPVAKSSAMPPTLLKALSSPIKNVTLNLPDFENPITIDSKVLEKISKLGKSETKSSTQSSTQAVQQSCSKDINKNRTSLPLKSEPRDSKKADSDGHFSDSSLVEKDAFGKIKKRAKKRKAKFGTYKLPNELKKKTIKKKETDSNSNKDKDENDIEDDDLNDMQNVKQKLCDNYLDSSSTVNMSLKSETSPQPSCAQKSAWDVLRNSRITPKTKNTLGSTRQKVGAGRFKAQSSLDSFLNRGCDNKSSQDKIQKCTSPVVEEMDISDRRVSLRKRKKEDDDSDDNTTDNTENRSAADTNTGNKKKRKEGDNKIIVQESPVSLLPSGPSVIQGGTHVVTPGAFRSLLPKSIASIKGPVAPSLVTAAHAPLILVPVNPASTNVVNAIPVPTSLATIPTSIAAPSTSAQQKIILSVPDSTLPGTGKTLNPPQYILMTNVNHNIRNVSPQVSKATLQPQIINSHLSMPLMPTGAITPGPFSARSSASPLGTSNIENTSEPSIGEKAPVLNRLLKQRLDTVGKMKDEKENDGSLSPLPGCPGYPVTPPKTPDDQRSEDSVSARMPTHVGYSYINAPPGPVQPEKDEIPLCSCKINGASFKKLGSSVTYCQALDSVDGKVMGCCNKVTNSQLIRPGVKIPFMAVCEAHRKRLRLHQCCPGCGHFCTQGKFAQCRKTTEGGDNVKIPIHYFHKQCQVLRNGRYYCPHCGEESDQFEISLSLDEPRSMTVFEEKQNKAQVSRAKMGIHAGTYRTLLKQEKEATEDTVTASYKIPSTDKTLSTGGLPFGPDKTSLEKALTCLSEDRPKNRKLPKLLYNPAYEGDVEKVVLMLADGCDPNEKVEDFDNQTALHAACIGGHNAIVHILLQVGAFLHATDNELKTPLMYAAEHGHLSMVEYLIKCKANICQRAEDGMTVLHYAAKAGHVDVMKVLLRTHEIRVNVQDDGGWTPIIWASEHRLVSAVKFLIDSGADPHLKDKEENTSLHWAAYSGSVDIAEMFLNAGCDLETPNEHGDRPLHIAARQSHYECVVLFLARGADVDVRNNENETPIQCCLDENSPVWLALRVNKQLKGFAASRLGRIQRVVDRDVSRGRENIPIAVINGVDDDMVLADFQYVTENVETENLNINRTINSLQSCRCSDDCSSMYCVCGRNSVKCWYDKGCHLLSDFNMTEPPLIFECNMGCRCWSTCNNRVVQNGIMCRLQLVKTDGRGWGVKTLLDIPKGTFICEYIGELISDSEADSREDDSYLFDLDNRDGDTYCIDARRYGNISRFINHLCEPNIIPVKVFVDHQDLRFPRICFFSSRDIKAGEELGFDYGEKFWIIKWKQFTCACNSPKCKYSKETIQKTLEEYRKRHEDEEAID